MKKERFQELLASVQEGMEILAGRRAPSRGFVVSTSPLEVRELRRGFGLSQERFARMMGISVGTLRNWEQGRRAPEGSARVLLRVVARHPEAVMETVFGTAAEEVRRERRR